MNTTQRLICLALGLSFGLGAVACEQPKTTEPAQAEEAAAEGAKKAEEATKAPAAFGQEA